MLYALLNAGIIYGLLWVFERKRRDFDGFDVPYVATVPSFIYLGLNLVVLFFGLGVLGSWVALAVFIIALFWMLMKTVKLPPTRAAAYSLAVLAINLGIYFLLTYKLR
jgi:hypothetical protein